MHFFDSKYDGIKISLKNSLLFFFFPFAITQGSLVRD
jgi:hypothetical protein